MIWMDSRPLIDEKSSRVKKMQRFLGVPVTGVWTYENEAQWREYWKMTDYGWDFATICAPESWEFCFGLVPQGT